MLNLTIDLELTNTCNAKCFFCPQDKQENNYISTKTIETLINKIKEYKKINHVYLCGTGEPLLHPQLLTIVELLSKNNIQVSLVTNGLLLTSSLAYKLHSLNINSINVSLHSFDIEKSKKLGFVNPIKVQNNLLSIKNKEIPIQINIQPVITKENYEDSNTIKNWALNNNFSFVKQKQNNRGGLITISSAPKAETNYLLDEIRKDNGLCKIPYTICFVSAKGEYLLCCNDFLQKQPLGNISSLSILESLKIKKTFQKNNTLCPSCII
jgi:MoaA/NifB/PqqE/SkfB family radical SAM enzyme